jgi:energy-coupling factor transport system substrate-specific component
MPTQPRAQQAEGAGVGVVVADIDHDVQPEQAVSSPTRRARRTGRRPRPRTLGVHGQDAVRSRGDTGPDFDFLLAPPPLLVSALGTGGVGPWLPYQLFALGAKPSPGADRQGAGS